MDQAVNTIWDLDCEDLQPEVVTELLRLAELRQEAMFSASLGMDQRAAVIGAGLVAVAGAIAAGGFAVSGTEGKLRLIALSMSALFCFGAGLCIAACRPQKSRFPGIEPIEWAYNRTYLANSIHVLNTARLAKLQEEMNESERKQSLNGKLLLTGLIVAWLAPALGLILWVC